MAVVEKMPSSAFHHPLSWPFPLVFAPPEMSLQQDEG